MTEYVVYWYKLKYHCNPFTQGYIGITKNLKNRNNAHLQSARKGKVLHFYNAIRKHGEEKVMLKVLHKCSKQEALDFENYYRPEPNIGWNMAEGGKDTLKSIRVKPITLYHKDDYNKLYEFSSHTEASETLGISRERLSQAVYRNSTHYGFDGWAILIDKDIDRSKTISIQEAISKRVSGTKRNKESHFKGMTNRWSDEDKKRISMQHKGKSISKKQIETVRRKNQESHSMCKLIELVNKDDETKVYKYHSIAEASRKLEIPLSRLKSKVRRPLNRYGKDGWKIKSLGSE